MLATFCLSNGTHTPALAGCGKTHYAHHSEEGSDEKSLFLLAFFKERFLASLGMTEPGAFFRSLLELARRTCSWQLFTLSREGGPSPPLRASQRRDTPQK